MLKINDLPEDVLVEVLSQVNYKDLIKRCRLVCALWRDIVDLPTLWKRKCQLQGFATKSIVRNPDDWRSLYFIFQLKNNLIMNSCATEELKNWHLDENGGHRWKVETLPGGHGQSFPDPEVEKYFVTSFELCMKSQIIDLKAAGYWEELLDKSQPDIVVTDWYAARHDCGCMYKLCVQLLSQDHAVLHEFNPEPVIIEQWSDAKWRQISHTFQKYGPGVRHIRFQHGGNDTQFWAGWYGIRVTCSSVVLKPQSLMD